MEEITNLKMGDEIYRLIRIVKGSESRVQKLNVIAVSVEKGIILARTAYMDDITLIVDDYNKHWNCTGEGLIEVKLA